MGLRQTVTAGGLKATIRQISKIRSVDGTRIAGVTFDCAYLSGEPMVDPELRGPGAMMPSFSTRRKIWSCGIKLPDHVLHFS